MNVTVKWEPNIDADLLGYRIYAGETSGIYTRIFTYLGLSTPFLPVLAPLATAVIAIADGQPTFVAITALDTVHNESAFSDEATIINRFVKSVL